MAKQEYISRTWLMQNTNSGMGVLDIIQAIIDAPVVEFDVDAVPVWKPCTRPPKESGSYIVCTNRNTVYLEHYYKAGNCWGHRSKRITHWMEKPAGAHEIEEKES